MKLKVSELKIYISAFIQSIPNPKTYEGLGVVLSLVEKTRVTREELDSILREEKDKEGKKIKIPFARPDRNNRVSFNWDEEKNATTEKEIRFLAEEKEYLLEGIKQYAKQNGWDINKNLYDLLGKLKKYYKEDWVKFEEEIK